MLDKARMNGARNDAAWMETSVRHDKFEERRGVVNERLVYLIVPVGEYLQYGQEGLL